MVACIVCGHDTKVVRRLASEEIRASLAELYREPIGSIPQVLSYEILGCPSCSLEFSWPMEPGDALFYSWIVRHNNYYPGVRWGWSFIRDMLAAEAAAKTDGQLVVIDIGCGGGAFLRYLSGIPNLRAIGIDMTQSSVQACVDAGLEAYCTDIVGAAAFVPQDIAAITAFHCLEHVPEPVLFIEEAKTLLRQKGRILVTTPYSPMSFEATWHDPLNHPPHHLTRWNRKAYEALASRVVMKVTITFAPSVSVLRGTLRSLLLYSRQTPFIAAGKLRKAISLGFYSLLHPLKVMRELRAQAARPSVEGRPSPDEVMVTFSFP